ncbi:MAG TPA: hypothetical protein VNV25_16130 [Gemmatimonadaceae bacterium]|nr:hypothetical protein [Gemmatimonadaceae bacterium]
MHTHLSDHLSAERLAALADDELTTSEAAHVTSCPPCAADLAAHRRLLAGAREEGQIPSVPLTRWETLAPQLAAAGLIRRRALRWPGRIAAALVFAAGGALFGRYTAMPRVVAQASIGADNIDDSMPIFRSAAEALATLNRAERDYRHASAYLVAQNPETTVSDRRDAYRARLAALDEVAQATAAGLQEVPNDPVLNQYYLSTVGARNATLRQLKGALPVGFRLERY